MAGESTGESTRGLRARVFVLAMLAGAALVLTGAPGFGQGARPGARPGIADGPCGGQRRGDPHRRKGGESFPPLPLPATPLRRTERKKPPAPPTLIAKLRWGRKRAATSKDGQRYTWEDWNHDPNDVKSLLQQTRRALGLAYGAKALTFSRLPSDPAEMPVLYLSGTVPLSLTERDRETLKRYLVAGGMLWADSCWGSKVFAASVRTEIRRTFGTSLRPVPADHPLYRSHYPITTVQYAEPIDGRKSGSPRLEYLLLGCRAAVVLSPYDLSCGWDRHARKGAEAIASADAIKLGVNFAAYAVGYARLGKALAASWRYTDPDAPKGDFTFGLVKHGGVWNPDPSGPPRFLKALREQTSGRIALRQITVDLATKAVFDSPFLYLTGHHDFTFNDAEIRNLRAFIGRGGFLLADACCGNLEFDRAFRRELQRVLPKSTLEPLAPDHPLFAGTPALTRVSYTTYVQKTEPDRTKPYLLAISRPGGLSVVYSPYDLGNGWEGEPHPWTRGLAADDAVKLGSAIVVYALTH